MTLRLQNSQNPSLIEHLLTGCAGQISTAPHTQDLKRRWAN